MAAKATDAFDDVFRALRAILRRHARALAVSKDVPGNLYVNTRKPHPNGGPMFFGAVRRGKAYVSYHLMPLYGVPALRDGLSPALRKRMQGKSCFNFRKPEPELFDELDALTKRGLDAFRKAGYA